MPASLSSYCGKLILDNLLDFRAPPHHRHSIAVSLETKTFICLRKKFVYAKTEQRPQVLETFFLKCPFFKLDAPRTALAYPVKEALRSFLVISS